MIKKIFVALMIGCGLFSTYTECHAALPKKYANISGIKPGDVIAVEMKLLGKTQIVLVYVQDGLFADYMYRGKLYPFILADLDKYTWAFYIKK